MVIFTYFYLLSYYCWCLCLFFVVPWFCLWSLIGAYPGYTYLYFSKFAAFNSAFDVAPITFSLGLVMWFFLSIMSARKRALFSLLIKVLSVCGSFLLCSNTSSTGCLRLVRNCVISLSFLLGLLIRRLGNKQLNYIWASTRQNLSSGFLKK